MNEILNERMSLWTIVWINEKKRSNECMDEWMNEQTNVWTIKWING